MLGTVLRHVTPTTRNHSGEKLAPNWEGPYIVVGIEGKDSYTLANADGQIIDKQ